MKKIFVTVLAILLLTSVPATLFAASPWTKETGYWNRTASKFVFGVKNVVFGWTEIFIEPAEAWSNAENLFLGAGKAIWYTIADTGGGALHAVTAPITVLDIPLPENGEKF